MIFLLWFSAGMISVFWGRRWLRTWQFRYKRHAIREFRDVHRHARTGDILLFHKTNRNGLLDIIELDLFSPLLYRECEFRHSGIIIRKDGTLFVLECTTMRHSGHADAEYVTSGKGIRLVPLERLLAAYDRDNGDPHYGIMHISREIEQDRVQRALDQYGTVEYQPVQRSALILYSRRLMPRGWHCRLMKAHHGQMMCSEFVHHFLHSCGVLRAFPSKLMAPYYLEDAAFLQTLALAPFADLVRFRYRQDKETAARASTANPVPQ